jgi:drug/metabolite transporter (DMT)-like permease
LRRLNADLLLGFAGLIWGFGFVAQKDASVHLGPFTFVAARFLISALFVLPFVVREDGLRQIGSINIPKNIRNIIALCVSFVAAVTLQQIGLATTTVTNTAFLTGVYIVLVPFAGLVMFRHKIPPLALLACGISLIGVWLLTGANPHDVLAGLNYGDMLVLLCALCFAFQVPMMGHIVGALRLPFTLSFLQFFATGVIALVLALCFETIDWRLIMQAWIPILYAGVASGGIAYTLQAIGQQHTPAVDSAIIMSSESLFGAIGGAWLLGETMNMSGYMGCAAIMLAILLVELAPFVRRKTA